MPGSDDAHADADDTQVMGCDIICMFCQKVSAFQDDSGDGASRFSL